MSTSSIERYWYSSMALVRDLATQIAPVIRVLQARHPSWLRGYRVRILDSNALSATPRTATRKSGRC